MEILKEKLVIGAIYRGEHKSYSDKSIILRFNGLSQYGNCNKCNFIALDGVFIKNSNCCSIDAKYYIASIEEMQQLEAYETASGILPESKNIIPNLLIFN